MNLPDIFRAVDGPLKKPGDKFSAEITKTEKQVVKIDTTETKWSVVKYPGTGTVVETIVHKTK